MRRGVQRFLAVLMDSVDGAEKVSVCRFRRNRSGYGANREPLRGPHNTLQDRPALGRPQGIIPFPAQGQTLGPLVLQVTLGRRQLPLATLAVQREVVQRFEIGGRDFHGNRICLSSGGTFDLLRLTHGLDARPPNVIGSGRGNTPGSAAITCCGFCTVAFCFCN